jgi:hypothetical protein
MRLQPRGNTPSAAQIPPKTDPRWTEMGTVSSSDIANKIARRLKTDALVF